ncbi:helix-turn-helix transcriptional regulator [Sphingobium abikonense]|uniref:helix-turn-helix transcriptional regulator n=1 Tax=Sphingobium abikonense TaxID=86193 RepID=UPI000787B278|nr:helix-turn-helix transcriptional regulator [Sphingobium abikonense]
MASAVGNGEQWADIFTAAALEPHRWDEALRAMAQATGSQHGQMVGFGPTGAAFNWISDVDSALIPASLSIDHGSPSVNYRVGADLLPNQPAIVHEAHYDEARQRLGEADYLDLCADFDIFDGCQTRMHVGPDGMIGLALLRSAKDGRTTPEQRDLFGQIAGHARAAVRLQQAIERQGFALLAGTFEAMDRACWLVDATGRVGGMTPAAEALLSIGVLRLAEGYLTCDRAADSRALARAVRAVLAAPALAADPVIVTDQDGHVRLSVECYPLPARPWALPFAPRAIIVARTGPPADRQAQQLMRMFQLTPAEADIAVRIASGKSRQQVAAARGVTPETLKVQLRSIYDKTGCGREAQLVRLVGLLMQ